MHVAYLDTSYDDIKHFEYVMGSTSEIKKVTSFSDWRNLLKFLEENTVDFVYCEIEMKNKSGLELIDKIRVASPDTHTVFVAQTPEYAIEAFEKGAAGYVLKPCSKEKLLIPIYNIKGNKPLIEIRTFGTFDLFVNNTAVLFSNKKAKEMLALMVDYCGKNLNMEQIIDVLWEERPFDNNTKTLYRIALKDLRDTLKKFNCSHILKEQRGQRSLDTTKVKCDYYEYLKHPDTYKGFFGEYMTNYSWGEYTLAKISGNFY